MRVKPHQSAVVVRRAGRTFTGISVRFQVERVGLLRRPTEVCYLLGRDGAEHRIGPINTLEWT